MLIHCPRCGFQQPEDKYCAQCGVYMENHKPHRPALWKRFFGSLVVQISLLILVVGLAGSVFFNAESQSIVKPLTFLKSKKQTKPSVAVASTPPVAAPVVSNSTAPEKSPTPLTAAVSATVTAPAAPTSAAQNLAGEPAPAEVKANSTRSPANTSTPRVEVIYAEVNHKTLNALFAASRNTGQFMAFNDYSAGILPNIDKVLADKQIQALAKDSGPKEKSKRLQWFHGIKDRQNPEMEVGLTTFFELSESDEGTLRGNIEIQRAWREPNSAGTIELQRKSFPAIFDVSEGNGFLISGVLPTQSNLENEDELVGIGFYKILRSNQFRSGESDFVIFVKFNKSP